MANLRKMVARVAVGAMMVVLVTAAPVGAKAGTTCDRGYLDPGARTLEQGLQLPRIEAGLSADPPPYTVEELTALWNVLDGNGDGLLCLKAVSNLRGNSTKNWGFFYLADDNRHPGELS